VKEALIHVVEQGVWPVLQPYGQLLTDDVDIGRCDLLTLGNWCIKYMCLAFHKIFCFAYSCSITDGTVS